MSNPPQNPYGAAADAYGNTASSVNPRALEGQILLKAAFKLEDLAKRLKAGEKVGYVEVGDILEYNKKLWQLFISDTMNPDHPLPVEIKSNIATLGVFVLKRTLEVLIDTKPEKLGALIEINRNIAAGLMKQPRADLPPVQNTLAKPPAAGAKPAMPPAAKPAADKDGKPTDTSA